MDIIAITLSVFLGIIGVYSVSVVVLKRWTKRERQDYAAKRARCNLYVGKALHRAAENDDTFDI